MRGVADFCRILAHSADTQAKTPSATLGSFANSDLIRFASFAETCFAKFFRSVSDWQKLSAENYCAGMSQSSTYAALARVFPKLVTNLQTLVFKLQICTCGRVYSTSLSLGKECQCAGFSAFAQYPLANFSCAAWRALLSD